MAAITKTSCIGDVATRLSSLSLDDDAQHVVIQGSGTICSDEMPFVNRHEELWQVFRVNAENMRQIMLSRNPIEDFRPLQLLFCVQVSRLSLFLPSTLLTHLACIYIFIHLSILELVKQLWAACSRRRSKMKPSWIS